MQELCFVRITQIYRPVFDGFYKYFADEQIYNVLDK